MTLEQVPNRIPDETELGKIIDRASPEELARLMKGRERVRTQVEAEEGIDDQAQKSAEFVAAREAKYEAGRQEAIAFMTDVNKPKEQRIKRLKAELWGVAEGVQAWVEAASDALNEKKMGFIESKVKEKLGWFWFLSSAIFTDDWKAKLAGHLGFFDTEWKDAQGKVLSWFIVAVVWWIFWKDTVEQYKKLWTVEAPNLDTPTIATPEAPVTTETVMPEGEGWADDEVIVEDSEGFNEEERTLVYRWGSMLLLMNTSGLELDWNDLKNTTLKALGVLPYWEIKTAYKEYLFSENTERYRILLWELWIRDDHLKHQEEKTTQILEAFVWTNARTTIESRLDEITLITWSDKFREKFPELQKKVDWKSIEDISFEDILTIFAFKVPVDISETIASTKMSIQKMFFWASDAVTDFITEIQEDNYDLVSQKMVKAFVKVDPTSFGDSSFVPQTSNERYKKEVNYDNLWEVERSQLDKIISFKDDIISNLKWDPLVSSYEHSGESFSILFDKGINYSEIVSMYLLLDWSSDISQLDVLEKLWLFWIVANSVSNWVDGNDQRFLAHVADEASKSLESEWWYFTPEESYFILSNLNQYSQDILENLLAWPNIARRILGEKFNDTLPEIWDKEWWLIWVITWWPSVAAVIPHIGVKLIAWGISAFWMSMALGKLNENGTLKRIFEDQSLIEIKRKIDKAMQIAWKWSLEEYLKDNPMPLPQY